MTDFDAKAREIMANARATMLRTGRAHSAEESIADALKAAYNEGLEEAAIVLDQGKSHEDGWEQWHLGWDECCVQIAEKVRAKKVQP